MLIQSAEQAIIDRVKAVFTSRLKMVDSLPSEWDDQTFIRLLRQAPAVYVAFAGGAASKSPVSGAVINSRFVLVAATTHASGEKARRHGDQREIGAYEICEILISTMHGFTLEGFGTLGLDALENLYTGEIDKQGGSIYGVAFTLPLAFDSDLTAPAILDNFLTYQDTFDLAPKNGQGTAQDKVTLEAAP